MKMDHKTLMMVSAILLCQLLTLTTSRPASPSSFVQLRSVGRITKKEQQHFSTAYDPKNANSSMVVRVVVTSSSSSSDDSNAEFSRFNTPSTTTIKSPTTKRSPPTKIRRQQPLPPPQVTIVESRVSSPDDIFSVFYRAFSEQSTTEKSTTTTTTHRPPLSYVSSYSMEDVDTDGEVSDSQQVEQIERIHNYGEIQRLPKSENNKVVSVVTQSKSVAVQAGPDASEKERKNVIANASVTSSSSIRSSTSSRTSRVRGGRRRTSHYGQQDRSELSKSIINDDTVETFIKGSPRAEALVQDTSISTSTFPSNKASSKASTMRSTSNRIWQTTEKVWGEPAKTWSEPERPWGEPAKVWGEPEKVWAEPAKVWAEPEKVWQEPEKPYVPPPTTTTTTPKPKRILQEPRIYEIQPKRTFTGPKPRVEKPIFPLTQNNPKKPDTDDDKGVMFFELGEDEDEEPLANLEFQKDSLKLKVKSTTVLPRLLNDSRHSWELPELTPQVDSSFIGVSEEQRPERPPTFALTVETQGKSFSSTSSQRSRHINNGAFSSRRLASPIQTTPISTTTTESSSAKEKSGKKFGYVLEGSDVRKYRVEERTPDGYIVGEYGVLNNENGFLRGVRYTADGTINPRLIHEALMKFLSL